MESDSECMREGGENNLDLTEGEGLNVIYPRWFNFPCLLLC